MAFPNGVYPARKPSGYRRVTVFTGTIRTCWEKTCFRMFNTGSALRFGPPKGNYDHRPCTRIFKRQNGRTRICWQVLFPSPSLCTTGNRSDQHRCRYSVVFDYPASGYDPVTNGLDIYDLTAETENVH